MRWRAYRAYVALDADPEPDLLAILAARVRQIERGKIRVPGELRRWQAAQPAAHDNRIGRMSTGARNEAMRKSRAAGETLTAIARRYGVSKSQAHRVTEVKGPVYRAGP
jgi:hypothetical protein